MVKGRGSEFAAKVAAVKWASRIAVVFTKFAHFGSLRVRKAVVTATHKKCQTFFPYPLQAALPQIWALAVFSIF